MEDITKLNKDFCFFCSNLISCNASKEMNLFNCLFRYLDLKELRKDNELFLTNSERSKLKLCANCTSLNKSFIKLFLQREKVEMEMAAKLKTICDKLLESENEQNSKSSEGSKPQSLKSLQKQTLQKCSEKLKTALPTVKLRKLTFSDINLVKSMPNLSQSLKITLIPTNLAKLSESDFEMSDSESEMDDFNFDSIKEEPESAAEKDWKGPKFFMETNTNFEDFASLSTPSSPSQNLTEPEMMTTTPIKNLQSLTDSLSKSQKEKNYQPKLLPPVIVNPAGPQINIDKKSMTLTNPLTGYFKCSKCELENKQKSHVVRHFRNAHLQIRYECPKCPKLEFTRTSTYYDHFRRIHMKTGFSCGKCGKMLKRRFGLKIHEEKCAKFKN